MLQPSTLKFLNDLKKNNNRPWFEKNKSRFENLKADFTEFVAGLLQVLGKTDPDFLLQDPSKAIFRIYRDVRFSLNKDPYKSHFSASFKNGGRKSHLAGAYLQIEPGASFMAAGYWQPEPPLLKLLRQEAEYNGADLRKILNDKIFLKTWGKLENLQLKKAPKGFDPDHPDIDLIKYTSYIVSTDLSDELILSKNLVSSLNKAYKTVLPFLNFLNRVHH